MSVLSNTALISDRLSKVDVTGPAESSARVSEMSIKMSDDFGRSLRLLGEAVAQMSLLVQESLLDARTTALGWGPQAEADEPCSAELGQVLPFLTTELDYRELVAALRLTADFERVLCKVEELAYFWGNLKYARRPKEMTRLCRRRQEVTAMLRANIEEYLAGDLEANRAMPHRDQHITQLNRLLSFLRKRPVTAKSRTAQTRITRSVISAHLERVRKAVRQAASHGDAVLAGRKTPALPAGSARML